MKNDEQVVRIQRQGLADILQFMRSRADLFPMEKVSEKHMLSREEKEQIWSTWLAFLDRLMVLDSMEMAEPKTKAGVQFLNNLKLKSALLVDQHTNTNLILSVRNIPKITAVDFNNLTVYDVLNHEHLVFSQRAFDSLMEKLS
jgi:large subunit ribosomal protein L4